MSDVNIILMTGEKVTFENCRTNYSDSLFFIYKYNNEGKSVKTFYYPLKNILYVEEDLQNILY
jgi:hypothetical protein